VHGILDYVLGVLMIASPWLLGFSGTYPTQWIAVAVGVLILLGGVIADHELGLVRLVPLRVHLAADVTLGALLVLAPWLVGFSDDWWWFVGTGLIEIGAGLATDPTPTSRRVSSAAA
jgi:hypothetical protein